MVERNVIPDVRDDIIFVQAREAIAKADVAGAKEWYQKAQKALDKGAEKNVIKKNNAARRKSRLNAAVKKLTTK